MQAEGGCYCGAVRYKIDGSALFKGECFCRPCQHISGGAQNIFMTMSESNFSWTEGHAKVFAKSPGTSVNRHFCDTCGTQILSTRPDMPGLVILKIGTLDDPSLFNGAKVSIFTEDKQPYHRVSEEFPAFVQLPPLG